MQQLWSDRCHGYGQSNAQGYFSLESSLHDIDFSRALLDKAYDAFLSLGLIKKIEVGAEPYGQFLFQK